MLDIRLLGPLEIRVGSEVLALGGAKQRAVLATLLLRTGDVVSIEQLVDELWGDAPPASAAHTLEVYVSRIRQLLNGHGPSLARRGAGYVLDLGDAPLDSREFSALAEDVSRATGELDHELVSARATVALALWRGSVLADVALGAMGRAEAERLEELRVRTLELRFDAELALGRHEAAVAELQSLVAQNPYRERSVAQLMLALYRSGRHAEALEVYEQTRRRLDDDLGLQPSADLRQLSGGIVRQEATLRAPDPLRATSAASPTSARSRTGRLAGLAAAGVAAAAVMALSAAGGASDARAVPEVRVALVLQEGSPVSAYPVWRARDMTDGLYDVAAQEGLLAELVELPDELTPADIASTTSRLADGRFELAVLALNAPSAHAIAPELARLDRTRFVFVDSSLRELGLDGGPNMSAIRFASEQPGQLAGALGGLLARRENGGKSPIVAVVAGERTRETRQVVAAFRRGASAAAPTGVVRVEYTGETLDPTPCELAANRQIDAGADLVFVHAGPCGEGALAVARARSVRAIASDGVGRARDNVMGAAFKDWDNALYTAVRGYLDGTLPRGRDVALGLDGYNVGLEMHPSLPPDLASRVVELCSDLRIHANERIRTYSNP